MWIAWVALVFGVFAVVVSIIALLLLNQCRSQVKRSRVLRRERKVIPFAFSVGPVDASGLLVTATGGAVLGLGCANGPFPTFGPPTVPADALDQNAVAVTRSGRLRNMYVTIGAVANDPSSPAVVRVSVYTAPCGTQSFTESSLIVRKTDVGAEPSMSCLADLMDTVHVGAGDRVAMFVRSEANAGALITALSASFELHH